MTTLHHAMHVGDGKWRVLDRRVNIPCFMFGSRAELVVRLERAKDAVENGPKRNWNGGYSRPGRPKKGAEQPSEFEETEEP